MPRIRLATPQSGPGILDAALQDYGFECRGRRAEGLTAEVNELGWLELEV